MISWHQNSSQDRDFSQPFPGLLTEGHCKESCVTEKLAYAPTCGQEFCVALKVCMLLTTADCGLLKIKRQITLPVLCTRSVGRQGFLNSARLFLIPSALAQSYKRITRKKAVSANHTTLGGENTSHLSCLPQPLLPFVLVSTAAAQPLKAILVSHRKRFNKSSLWELK